MVLDVDFVNFAIFVAALGDRGRMAARDGFDLAQQAVEDIAPMGEHIEDETAACHLAVVPTRPLCWIQLAVEHPPAEIQPDRKNPAKEIGIIKLPELSQPGQEQFILDDATLETGMLCLPRRLLLLGRQRLLRDTARQHEKVSDDKPPRDQHQNRAGPSVAHRSLPVINAHQPRTKIGSTIGHRIACRSQGGSGSPLARHRRHTSMSRLIRT